MSDLERIGEWYRRLYDEWGVRHLGLVCPEVPILEEAFRSEDPFDLLYAVFEFAEWATDEAKFLDGEISAIAIGSWLTEKYVADCENGGHDQYLSNKGWDGLTFRYVEKALLEMQCHDYRAQFLELNDFVLKDPAGAQASARRCDTIYKVPEYDRKKIGPLLDQVSKQAAWLRASGALRPLPMRMLEDAKRKLLRKNCWRETRQRDDEATLSLPGGDRHAINAIAKSLATSAGLKPGLFFQGFRSALSTYFLGELPRPVLMWRFLHDDKPGRVQDIVLVPRLNANNGEAVLFIPDHEGPLVRTEIDARTWKKAMYRGG